MAGENYVFLISLYMRLFLILMMNELGAYKYRPCFYDLTRLETCDCQLIELFFFPSASKLYAAYEHCNPF